MPERRSRRRAAGLFAKVFERARTLRVRLTLAVTVVFGLALSVGAISLVSSVEHTVVRAVEAADRAQLERIRLQIERGVPVAAVRLAEDTDSPGTFIEIRKRDGSVIDLTRSAATRPALFPPAGRTVPATPLVPAAVALVAQTSDTVSDATESTGSHPSGGFTRGDWSVVKLVSESPEAGPLTLLAASPLADVRRSTATLGRVLWVTTPALLVLIAAGAWLLTGRALSPVLAMTRRVEGITTRTLHARLPEPGTNDEIAELARTLNKMLSRLDQAARRQREFVSDASHELRSPVASLRAQLEVALAHPARADWEGVARGALAEGLRLETLIADLLLLARLDEGARAALHEVDVDDVVLDEARRARRVTVGVAAVGPGRVLGDAGHLGRVAQNLLDNAARHAKSRVEVGVARRGGLVVLTVDDDGPGVPVRDRERVFERFTRLEEARCRDAGGVGLGLALVRRIAERHGGRASLADSPLGGARAVVELPRAVEAEAR